MAGHLKLSMTPTASPIPLKAHLQANAMAKRPTADPEGPTMELLRAPRCVGTVHPRKWPWDQCRRPFSGRFWPSSSHFSSLWPRSSTSRTHPATTTASGRWCKAFDSIDSPAPIGLEGLLRLAKARSAASSSAWTKRSCLFSPPDEHREAFADPRRRGHERLKLSSLGVQGLDLCKAFCLKKKKRGYRSCK